MSHDFFALLGASAVLGRTFTEDEDRVGAAPSTVLSHELWTRRYGAEPQILGRGVELSGRDYVVVGIAPKGFTGVTLQPAASAQAIAGQSRGSSGRRSRLRGALTVTQSALSVVLLVGAGLFVRSLEEVRSLDLGLDVDRLALASLELSTAELTAAEETELYARAAERVQTLSAVRHRGP